MSSGEDDNDYKEHYYKNNHSCYLHFSVAVIKVENVTDLGNINIGYYEYNKSRIM
jgi:hypothetical protein